MMKKEQYESITFDVEKDLKKPTKGMYKAEVKETLAYLFQKKEILTYEMDTSETSFYNSKKKSLIAGYINAYNNHYPMTISPDIIWILIMQVFSRFMDKYSELVRERFVNFKGKKEIMINRLGLMPKEIVWSKVFEEITTKIGEYIGKECLEYLTPNFSTTSPVSLTTGQISLMTGMKNYFEYKVACGGCGVSQITLEGSLQDWNEILKKVKYLENYALKWWTKHIIPIIEKIIETKKYMSKKSSLNSSLKEFWKSFIKIKDNREKYIPDVINGWLIKFFPDIANRTVPESMKEFGGKFDDFPEQILNCPMQLICFSIDGTEKTIYDCSIESGFYGMVQDSKTFNVKPVIGYSLIVVKTEKSSLSVEEKNDIIKKCFE